MNGLFIFLIWIKILDYWLVIWLKKARIVEIMLLKSFKKLQNLGRWLGYVGVVHDYKNLYRFQRFYTILKTTN